jgi:predicted nucleic acid-binding protein
VALLCPILLGKVLSSFPSDRDLIVTVRLPTSVPNDFPENRLSTAQQWPDAHLAAFAKVAALTLVTFDRALSKLAGEEVLLLR